MSNKISSFSTEHYSNTYIEQFCKALHPNKELDASCVTWFSQATKHCIELISDIQKPSSYIWKTVMNIIFPERSTELLSLTMPITIPPNRLSIHDCQSLFLDIANDYIQRAPRYVAESKTNVMLWQVLYFILGITALISILMGTIYTFNKYGKSKKMYNSLAEFFKPEKRIQAVAKHSLHLAKAEVQLLKVPHIIKPESLIAPDGTNTLLLKVSTKFDFLDSIVKGSLQTFGGLYRLHDKPKSEFKMETLAKAMKFLNNNCKTLHLLLIFDDDPVVYEGNVITKSPPSQSSPLRSPSTRSSLKKSIFTPVLGDGTNKGITPKVVATSTAFGYVSNSPRSNSYRQGITPRSGTPPTSGIHRITAKRTPKNEAKKFK